MSIVADASLGLELSAGLVPDTDLYAHDLGQRRKALLRNWTRLHELRSAPPGKAPSPRALRLEVETEALTALAVVLTWGASPAEPAEAWPGAIQNLAIELLSRPDRPGLRLVPAALPSPPAATLLQAFQNVAAALRGCLVTDADGRPTGWPRDLRELPELPGEATPTSTAYGIKTMLLLEDGLAADLVPVAESLRKMSEPAGGYAGRDQSGPRPEATAAVLNALRRITATGDFDAHIAQMERSLGDFEKARPFILTTMLAASLLIKPRTRLVETLVDSLLAARLPYGDVLLWPEKRAGNTAVQPGAGGAGAGGGVAGRTA